MARATCIPDRFYSSVKVVTIPHRHRYAAVGVFLAGLTLAGENTESDYKVIKAEWLKASPGVVAALVTAGLWTRLPGDYYRIEGEGDLWDRESRA